MLQELELTNFRQHRERTVTFGPGLNVIRAANEQGKSTLFLAVAYAFWGSRALPESLDETVTWGENASSLCVKLKFTYQGSEYTIVRRKSGAELVGPNVTASGQAEVTTFIERLFKASYQVGFATVVANQGKLQEGIESGAVALIEKLSNMGLIDDLVTHIQGSLPSGNTKVLENQLVNMAPGPEPVADFQQFQDSIQAAKDNHAALLDQQREAADRLQALQEPADKADQFLIEQAGINRDIQGVQGRIASLTAALKADISTPVIPNIGELEAKQLEQAQNKAVYDAWHRWHKIGNVEPWPGTVKEFVAEATRLTRKIPSDETKRQQLLIEIARIEASAITQDSCAFCGLDLKDVPAVAEVNERVKVQVAALQDQVKALAEEIAHDKVALRTFTARDEKNTANQQIAAGIAEYVFVDTTVVPCRVDWVGPVPPESVDSTDYGAMIRQARQTEERHRAAIAKRAATESELLAVRAQHVALQERRAPVEEANDALAAAQAAQRALDRLSAQVTQANVDLQAAKQALAWAETQHDAAVAQWNADTKRREEMQAILNSMVFHNNLIRKLREARPIVARELWNMVLSGVSQIFSQIRGTASVVTRDSEGFRVDDRKTSSLSGSTKDALGLANRIMLQKTFMGGLDFLLLDEPAAACDEIREVDMLSAVTRADYAQIILVTHSDKADAFATNIINF